VPVHHELNALLTGAELQAPAQAETAFDPTRRAVRCRRRPRGGTEIANAATTAKPSMPMYLPFGKTLSSFNGSWLNSSSQKEGNVPGTSEYRLLLPAPRDGDLESGVAAALTVKAHGPIRVGTRYGPNRRRRLAIRDYRPQAASWPRSVQSEWLFFVIACSSLPSARDDHLSWSIGLAPSLSLEIRKAGPQMAI
jgi:hypothetical protein